MLQHSDRSRGKLLSRNQNRFRSRVHDAWLLALVMALAFLGTVATVAEAQNVDETFYVTNGPVSAEALLGHTLYIAGNFSQVGPATGGGVPLDAVSGALVNGFPKVSGYVYTVIADGNGGWYIGGSFLAVGGIARHNIAHILADNSVSS